MRGKPTRETVTVEGVKVGTQVYRPGIMVAYVGKTFAAATATAFGPTRLTAALRCVRVYRALEGCAR